MHLEGPWLSLSGKRKGKQKFRNADEARRARELAQEWEQKQAEWKAMSRPVSKSFTIKKVSSAPAIQPQKIPSLNSWVTGAVSSKQNQQYTGTKMLGIGTLHKSNAVPVFSDDEAKDISRMRR
jgi:N-acetylglucosamine-6-phosphate deacetylase